MNATQTTAKKTWSKPQILVLLRSKPEEAVLISCKTDGGGGSSPLNTDSSCQAFSEFCSPCVSLGGS